MNLAAISDLDKYPLSTIYDNNAFSIVRILELLKDINYQGRFINTSSSLVYNTLNNELYSEHDALKPRHHYSCAKAMIDNMFSIMGNELDLLSVRPFNCIGVGQSSRYVVPKIIKHFKNKNSCIELGSIDNKRDFTDARDIAEMYEMVCFRKPVNTNAINFCSGVGTSIREILNKMEELTGHHIKVEQSSSLIRADDNYDSVGDVTHLKEIGFSPKYNLSDTLLWMLNN